MGRLIQWLFLVFCILGPQALLAADLYVSTSGNDSNPGTAAAPLRTIPKASSLAKPGTTVHVAPGTYVGSFTTSASGTASAYVTFISDVKHAARLVPASSTSDSSAWNVTGNYVIVDGFDVDGQSTLGWRRGIFATGSHIVIKNNHVHHIGMRSSCDNRGGAGISGDGYYGGAFHDVLNNITDHIGPANWVCTGYHGIYMASFDFTVKNNLTFQNGGAGIHVNHDWGRGYIANNTAFRNKIGILAEGADFINISIAGPITIVNNLVYDNNPNGSPIGNVGGIGVVLAVTNNNVIANNYAFNNRDLEVWMVSGRGVMSNNITTGSPGFVNYQPDGSGNFRLASTSQLIDKGRAANAPFDDLDGRPRPQGAGFDIGAYEFGAAAPTPSPAPTPMPAPGPTPSPTVTIDGVKFAPGSTVTVTLKGTGLRTDEWIALYRAQDPDSAYSHQENWMYLNGTKVQPMTPITSTVLKVPVPMDPGTYNIRLFGMVDYHQRVAISPNFEVAMAQDTTAPVTGITSPIDGSSVLRRSTVTVSASASDNVAVTKVEFFVNGVLKCADTTSEYTCNVSVSRRSGRTYSIFTKAYDASGNVGFSPTVKITTR